MQLKLKYSDWKIISMLYLIKVLYAQFRHQMFEFEASNFKCFLWVVGQVTATFTAWML